MTSMWYFLGQTEPYLFRFSIRISFIYVRMEHNPPLDVIAVNEFWWDGRLKGLVVFFVLFDKPWHAAMGTFFSIDAIKVAERCAFHNLWWWKSGDDNIC